MKTAGVIRAGLLARVSRWIAIALIPCAQASDESAVAYNRIVHGWTNYSTAFNATHDTGTAADYASVGTLYRPGEDATLSEFAAIVIWSGQRSADFSRFQYRVFVWSDLDAFLRDPRQGDVANWSFAAPTGGSTSTPDAITRGGREAYELRFALTNQFVTLSSQRSYVVGFAARADTQTAGELFVPTSSHEGPSDFQAGDLVPGGWQELVNAGGSTIYDGELAVELLVRTRTNSPPLAIEHLRGFIRLSWPDSARDFVPEYSLQPSPTGPWFPVEAAPLEDNGQIQVTLPAPLSSQWFRLRR